MKADGGVVEIYPENGACFKLRELQLLVGGYIEAVRLPADSLQCGLWLIVNEEGRLQNLPVNRRASIAAGRWIVGDAVLVTFKEMEGREEWEPEGDG